MNKRHSSRSKHSRRGTVLQVILGVFTLGAVGFAGILSVRVPVAKAPFSEESHPREVESALGALGLTPKVVAAAGLTSQQTGSFADAAASYMHTNITAYRTAKNNAYLASNEVDRLTTRIRSGQGNQSDVEALATAQANLNTAHSQEQAVLAGALAAAGEEIPTEVFAKVNLFKANKLVWDIPEQYLGENRTQEQWVALRDAIANDTIATRLNQEPDPSAHQLLLAAQATSSAAATNFQNLEEIRAAWNLAMQP